MARSFCSHIRHGDMLDIAQITDRDGSIELAPAAQQVAWEHAQMMRLFDARQPRCILEVGSLTGGTLRYWIEHTPPGSMVVSVDDQARDSELWHQWALESGVRLRVIRGDSHNDLTITQARTYAPYDWVFIDADHTYDGVASDWQFYGGMVKPGGIVALHDIVKRNGYGVHRLWRSLQAHGYVTQEIIAQSSWCGIGIIYVD